MKQVLIGISICLVIAALAGGHSVAALDSIERPFAEGQFVRLKLASGDYTIRAGSPDRIFVQWQAETPSGSAKMKKIKVNLDTSGSAATIRTDGPTSHVRFLIEIPPRSDLELRIFAGDVSLEGIQGDKDIKMTFGDLNIDAGPAAYSEVRASVKLGDLSARRFRISEDGVGQAFAWQGNGSYRLHARLFAGDLTLN